MASFCENCGADKVICQSCGRDVCSKEKETKWIKPMGNVCKQCRDFFKDMKRMSNSQAKYYTPPGSYNGLVREGRRWYRVEELNRINKTGWIRWQGPPSAKMEEALHSSITRRSDIAYPERAN